MLKKKCILIHISVIETGQADNFLTSARSSVSKDRKAASAQKIVTLLSVALFVRNSSFWTTQQPAVFNAVHFWGAYNFDQMNEFCILQGSGVGDISQAWWIKKQYHLCQISSQFCCGITRLIGARGRRNEVRPHFRGRDVRGPNLKCYSTAINA